MGHAYTGVGSVFLTVLVVQNKDGIFTSDSRQLKNPVLFRVFDEYITSIKILFAGFGGCLRSSNNKSIFRQKSNIKPQDPDNAQKSRMWNHVLVQACIASLYRSSASLQNLPRDA